MALPQQTRELFSKVFGRAPEGPEENRFLQDLAQRKPGAGEQLGALQFRQQQGGGAPGGGQQSAALDPLDAAIQSVQSAARNVAKSQQKLFTEDLRQKLRSELLSNPGFKQLQDLKGQLAKTFQETGLSDLEASAEIDPVAQARFAAGARGDIAQQLSTIGEQIRTQESDVSSFLDRLAGVREQELQAAQTTFDVQRNMLDDIIQVQREKRFQEESDFERQTQIQKIQSAGRGRGRPAIGETTDELESFAQSYWQGIITKSDIPQRLRNKAIQRAKEIEQSNVIGDRPPISDTEFAEAVNRRRQTLKQAGKNTPTEQKSQALADLEDTIVQEAVPAVQGGVATADQVFFSLRQTFPELSDSAIKAGMRANGISVF